MKAQRRRLLVDRNVQLGLVGRLVLHWWMLLVTAAVTLPLFRTLLLGDVATPLAQRLQNGLVDAVILLAVFVLLLPYFIYDSLKMTNRFSGPVYRLRHTMRAIAAGARLHPLQLRKGDYWHELANDFNRMIERLQHANDAAASQAESTEHEAVASS